MYVVYATMASDVYVHILNHTKTVLFCEHCKKYQNFIQSPGAERKTSINGLFAELIFFNRIYLKWLSQYFGVFPSYKKWHNFQISTTTCPYWPSISISCNSGCRICCLEVFNLSLSIVCVCPIYSSLQPLQITS